MHLYLLTFASGKSYVGQTQRTLKLRMQQHRAHARADSQLAVHCAWRKHGEPAVELLGSYGSADELHAAEIAAIVRCGTLSPGGYNVGFGGETAPSKSPEVAAKIAAKATGRRAPESMKAGASERMKVRMSDPAYRGKMAADQAAYWTPERRAAKAEESRIRATGVKFTAERKAKIGQNTRNASAETRAKMSAAAKARGVTYDRTPEVRAQISSSIAASWADPEIRARRSAAIRAGHARRKAEKGTVQ